MTCGYCKDRGFLHADPDGFYSGAFQGKKDDEVKHLEAVNRDLLKALRLIRERLSPGEDSSWQVADDAIERAKERGVT